MGSLGGLCGTVERRRGGWFGCVAREAARQWCVWDNLTNSKYCNMIIVLSSVLQSISGEYAPKILEKRRKEMVQIPVSGLLIIGAVLLLQFVGLLSALSPH